MSWNFMMDTIWETVEPHVFKSKKNAKSGKRKHVREISGFLDFRISYLQDLQITLCPQMLSTFSCTSTVFPNVEASRVELLSDPPAVRSVKSGKANTRNVSQTVMGG